MDRRLELKNRIEQKKVKQIDNHNQELESIIDSEISKSEEIEKVAKVIKEVEKGNKVPLKTDDEIFREIIKFRSVEHTHFVNIMKELHYLKKHYLKVTTTLLFVACFGSYVAGTQHQVIAPYIGKAFDVVSSLKGE